MNHERIKEIKAFHFSYAFLREAEKVTWIDEILHATEEVETPVNFIRWGALCAISAILRNKVYLDKHYYKLYPNIYVLLVGESGLRKGFAPGLSKELVRIVGGTRIIAGRNSIQGIIKELSTTSTSQNGGPPITHSSAYINSGEFSTSLVKDPDALTILTDLYDGHYNPEWKNTLKSGSENLKGVNLTLFGAMNPTHFNDLITSKEITGGFIARTILVREFKRARRNDLLDPPENKYDINSLASYLKDIDKLTGTFSLAPEAKSEFRNWYKDFDAESIEDKTGTANRVHDQILKVSMLIAVSRKLELIIQKEDIKEAMDLCLTSSSEVGKITAGAGISVDSAKITMVMQKLLLTEGNTITRLKLLQVHYGDFTALELDNIIQTLEDAGAVKQLRVGKEMHYTLKPEVVEKFRAIMRSKT